MILRGATSLRGALEGVGPENRDFFGPWNGTSEAIAIWAQKVGNLIFFEYFLAGYIVLATPLLMSPNFFFWEMSGFEPRQLP